VPVDAAWLVKPDSEGDSAAAALGGEALPVARQARIDPKTVVLGADSQAPLGDRDEGPRRGADEPRVLRFPATPYMWLAIVLVWVIYELESAYAHYLEALGAPRRLVWKYAFHTTRIDVLNLLGDLKARGLGILFITHDLSLGNYISDRTVMADTVTGLAFAYMDELLRFAHEHPLDA
jgi:hypothetical protein